MHKDAPENSVCEDCYPIKLMIAHEKYMGKMKILIEKELSKIMGLGIKLEIPQSIMDEMKGGQDGKI